MGTRRHLVAAIAIGVSVLALGGCRANKSDEPLTPAEQQRRVQVFAAELSEDHFAVRIKSARALAELAQTGVDIKAALPALTEALDDTEVGVRAWSAGALGLIGQPAEPAVPDLVILTSDEDRRVREAAVIALGLIAVVTDDVVLALTRRRALDDNEEVRYFALGALRRMGDQALPPLKAAQQHPNARVRQAATDVLRELRPE